MKIDPVSDEQYRARILDPGDAADQAVLERLRSDAGIEVIDGVAGQAAGLRQLTPAPEPTLLKEPTRWAYYPWRRALVSVLGPRAFRRVRLDRNRHLITDSEQDRLAEVRVGVVGLSVGHAVAHTLAAQGVCGELRLADGDRLDLANLNRVPATVLDLGANKAVVAARRIAELDPYLSVQAMASAVTAESLDAFLDGLDIVVEECDSLDMKVLVRQGARARRLPVLMATSDRGLVDVERFDLQSSRPLLHGLLGQVDPTALAGLTGAEKIGHVLRLIDVAGLSPRGAASLIEIGHGVATWPQLAADVAVGAGAIAEAVRRIGLGEPLPSGRVSIDLAAALEHVDEPPDHRSDRQPFPPDAEPDELDTTAVTVADAVVAAAIRAPSGGNAQPWRITTGPASITIALDPGRTSAMDVGLRGSAVAVGAAVFNARVAAAAHSVLGSVTVSVGDNGCPLRAVIGLDGTGDAALAELYQPMLDRETNRHLGRAAPLAPATAALLQSAAADLDARLRLLTDSDDIHAAAEILADADRIRYLTPRLHADVVAELRWPPDNAADSGIDVRSLELDSAQLAVLDLLRRPQVMAQLAACGGGAALGADTRARVTSSSALGVIGVQGSTLPDYARGGSAAEAVWVTAHHHGLAVQPISPVFLYAHNPQEVEELSPRYAATLHRLRHEFLSIFATPPDESPVLVIRLFQGPKPSVRSRRRPNSDA